MATAHELEILQQYSTPGLRKNQLTRMAKEAHLRGLKTKESDVKELCDKLYGPVVEILQAVDVTVTVR